ncbi:MAG: hypothetical protein ACPGU7_08410 [Gammaproteobacteria bacterium]
MSSVNQVVVGHPDAVTAEAIASRLRSQGCDPVVVNDGATALDRVRAEGGPKLAVLSEDLQGPDVLGVCSEWQLVSPLSGVQPFLVILGGRDPQVRARINEVGWAVLFSTCDDGDLCSMVAMGQKMIAMQVEMLRYIEDLESLIQRHDLSSELVLRREQIRRRGERQESEIGIAPPEAPRNDESGESVVEPAGIETSATELPVPTIPLSEKLRGTATMAALAPNLTELFDMLGFEARPVEISAPGPLSVWCSIYVEQSASWVEMALSCSPEGGDVLVETLLGVPPMDGKEMRDGLAEILNMAQGAIKTGLEDEGWTTIYPYLPKARATDDLAMGHVGLRWTLGWEVNGVELAFTVMERPARAQNLSLGSIAEGQVALEDLYSPMQPDIPMLHRGAIINGRYQQQLSRLARVQESMQLNVVGGTPLAASLEAQ